MAHPDDEVLGAGASMWKWSHDGDEVEVCIMCTEAKARAFRPSDAELEGDSDDIGDGEIRFCLEGSTLSNFNFAAEMREVNKC